MIITDEMLTEHEHYERIRAILELSEEFLESELDEQTTYIMDHKFYFPEYF